MKEAPSTSLAKNFSSSGDTPFWLISSPEGVAYDATVSISAPPLDSPNTPWITPFPYVRWPSTAARQLSCNAPASTSPEDAVFASTHTCSGSAESAFSLEYSGWRAPFASLTYSTSGRSISIPAMPSAPSSTPPPLPRRSRTSFCAPSRSSSRSATRIRRLHWALNSVSFR